MTGRKLIPILYTPEMAAANILGVKSETRRTRGLDKYNENPDKWIPGTPYVRKSDQKFVFPMFEYEIFGPGESLVCPYGKPGDVIWQRETWRIHKMIPNRYHYKSDYLGTLMEDAYLWKPNLHMPLRACRFFAEITEIRLERLLDIDEAGATREGIIQVAGETDTWPDHLDGLVGWDTPKGSYLSLWDKINGLGSSEFNPWVFVLVYKRLFHQIINPDYETEILKEIEHGLIKAGKDKMRSDLRLAILDN